ncbi:MAG: flagellar export chaperone FliS [Acidobacteriota bacterium]
MGLTNNYALRYQEMEVHTADPFDLILILYKGAIRELGQASAYFASGDIEKRVARINKAIAMISELQTSLNFEKGGEIAASLDRLYTYMLRRISQANAQQDPQPVEEVVRLLSTLLSGWEEARQTYRMTQKAPRVPSAYPDTLSVHQSTLSMR